MMALGYGSYLNKWNARGNIRALSTRFPASRAECHRPPLWIWAKAKRACGCSPFAELELGPLVAVCQWTSRFLSTYRRCKRELFKTVRVSARDSPMEGACNAEVPVAREPTFKKQACESGHVNGYSDGSDRMPVAHSHGLRVKKLAPEAILPSRGSALAAGYDLSSAYDATVPARGKALIKTELSIAIPEGTYARVAPRSGLAWKHSIDVGAGVIDADYRGPLGVILFNHSDTEFSIKQGDRIAQLILERIVTPVVVEVDDLDATARGEGGFGSTGVAFELPVVFEPPPPSS